MSESKVCGFFVERKDLLKKLENVKIKRWQIFTKSLTEDFFKYRCDYYFEDDVKSDTKLYEQDGLEVRLISITYPWDTLFDKEQVKNSQNEDLYPLHFVLQQSVDYFNSLEFTTFDDGQRIFFYDSGEFKESGTKEKLLNLCKFFNTSSGQAVLVNLDF